VHGANMKISGETLQEESITLAPLKTSTAKQYISLRKRVFGPYAVNVLEQRQHISKSAVIA